MTKERPAREYSPIQLQHLGMLPNPTLQRRQIWASPTRTGSTLDQRCTPFELPAGGILTIDDDTVITVTNDLVYQPYCTGQPMHVPYQPGIDSALPIVRDPFYASTTPKIYTIAATTMVSYMLLIMLFITPRTFFRGSSGGRSRFFGQRGMISGASGSSLLVGVGTRPWLQKVAALTVVVSLTIASVDNIKVAAQQYEDGYQDASSLTHEAVGGLEVRVVRVISDTFLWLAQVQTLIRLFPRHNEKVIIKWAGFALIVLDTTFSIVNSFVVNKGRMRPRNFDDAIPALTYLFELALSLLYAIWVIYYALSKKRYAFFHKKMPNICLVALISLAAILIPVVFFMLDIFMPAVAGWGDYVRWVGAEAASVVVWEWVERIEALERDERKDGILGREVFEEDGMLDLNPSVELSWSGNSKNGSRGGGSASGKSGTTSGWHGMTNITSRFIRSRPRQPNGSHQGSGSADSGSDNSTCTNPTATPPNVALQSQLPIRPPSVASPVSRVDTMSATSTVYAVHYHPVMPPTSVATEATNFGSDDPSLETGHTPSPNQQPQEAISAESYRPEDRTTYSPRTSRWHNVPNIFKRRRASPPAEVAEVLARATKARGDESLGNVDMEPQARKIFSLIRGNNKKTKRSAVPLPITIIPAQPPGRTWSPGSPIVMQSTDVVTSGALSAHQGGEEDLQGLGEASLTLRQAPAQVTLSLCGNPLAPDSVPSASQDQRQAPAQYDWPTNPESSIEYAVNSQR